MNATALIAEDEPLLAQALQAELARAWPGLKVLATVGDGDSAVAQALALRPDVLFLDIRMPGQTGLQAAAELAEEWPEGVPFPALVFVTAFDAYAVAAFEAQAVDYVLKPVQPERLARTVQRVQQVLAQRTPASTVDEPTLQRLRALLGGADATAGATPARLQVIPASVGQGIRMVPVGEVLVFEAADKYVRVLTADSEVLIRTPLKELMPQLDPAVFWQIHRGTVVRADAIDSVTRNEAGRLSLRLRGRPEAWAVSRLYAERFRAM
ncbi:MAG: LytTR family DNA-binding domain-containing protein [Hydrogenophaga sp.]|jgi:DNA-binding LytR/AlgR family response regulator|uniref:LytR/AlgR family response regulator transcription factor n=1 Tax=Hydrogenophaga sp. TaxID=1904254 RepID=UPI001DB61FF6|nr:LytTR family DNA-binding domain-containing protein [Hydrogenophaga sp.]MBW0171507.1 LytTR family DNA-binding domain-containing protein [Hydrogenophaga sp.]MBW0185113.1 LytTR family DNA-binding domain-containing protein [Hydrogenophaga sp.]